MRVSDSIVDIAYWRGALTGAAREYMSASSHDFDHLDRVYRMVEVIAAREGGDAEVLVAAAYLHDIGRSEEAATGVDHALAGAREADDILKRLGFPKEKIAHVVECIRTHRFRTCEEPSTLEAKILFDADKLDAMGAIGVARAYAHAGENNQRLFFEPDGHNIHHNFHETYSPVIEYELKLKHLKDKLYTQTGGEIAERRHEYMEDFFERLRCEVNGTE